MYFNFQVLIVGEFKGQKVQDVKKVLQKTLIDSNKGIIYYEPEKTIISRYVNIFLKKCTVSEVYF